MEKIHTNPVQHSNWPVRLFIASCILLLLSVVSCKKFVAVTPLDQVSSQAVFNSDLTATAAVLGIYTKMTSGAANIGNTVMATYSGLSADEFYETTTDANAVQFYSNNLLSNNSYITSAYWDYGYQLIYQANACIEGVNASTTLTSGVKNQLLGESKFVRAFIYFYLVNVFGDVPLITSTDYIANARQARTPSDEVYNQIIADLNDAQGLLVASHPTAGRLRPNKWAAVALLARVYLYQKNWQQAATLASSVIGSNTYGLETNPNNVFLTTSNEGIWEMVSTISSIATYDGNYFIPSSPTVKPEFTLTNSLLNAFELNDNRRLDWVNTSVIGGTSYSYPYKYKARFANTTTGITEYYMQLRLAEQYLIVAEADAQLGNTGDALQALNAVRNRAGLPNVTDGTSSTLLPLIAHENQIEFFGEWGHRWLDLKRTGQIDAVLSTEKPGWKTSDALYPVPQSEILFNTALTQNPGY